MISPLLRLLQLLLPLLIFLSCGQNAEQTKGDLTPEKGSPLYYYKKAVAAEDRREKLDWLNKGLSLLDDNSDTIAVDLLRYKVTNHYKLKQYDSVIHYTRPYNETARFHKDSSNIAESYWRKGDSYYQLNIYEEAFRYAAKSKEIYLDMGDSARAGWNFLDMAMAQRKGGDFTGSQNNATQSLRFLNSTDSAFIAEAFNQIAISYTNRGFYTEAVEEYQNYLRYATSPSRRHVAQMNMAMAWAEGGDYQKALGLLEALLNADQKIQPLRKNQIKEYFAFYQWKLNPKLDISDRLNATLQVKQQSNDIKRLHTSYFHLAEFYRDKNPALAYKYAVDFLQIAKQTENASLTIKALEQLIALSPPAESKQYAQEYIRLTDSVTNARLQAKHLFAKIEYDEEQKEKQILSLEARNALQKAEVAEQRQRKTLYFSGAILLLLGGGFFFHFLRQRHKREKLQEVYRTEARISKKVHDELSNDIYTIMSQAEITPQARLLDKLEDVYKRTRDISRENSSIKTGEGFGKELLVMLGNYTPSSSKLFTRGQDTVAWQKISEEKQIVVYRVLQELMTNMKKHSQARIVAVTFEEKSRELQISYSDNGVGIAKEKLGLKNGLRNVESRISSVGGSFSLDTAKGEGVKVEVRIPL